MEYNTHNYITQAIPHGTLKLKEQWTSWDKCHFKVTLLAWDTCTRHCFWNVFVYWPLQCTYVNWLCFPDAAWICRTYSGGGSGHRGMLQLWVHCCWHADCWSQPSSSTSNSKGGRWEHPVQWDRLCKQGDICEAPSGPFNSCSKFYYFSTPHLIIWRYKIQ